MNCRVYGVQAKWRIIMLGITVGEIAEATGGKIIFGNKNDKIESIMTDSRKADRSSLFIPFKGERADGHEFIGKAFENGACAALTEKEIGAVDGKSAILVENTQLALGMIAKYYKKKFRVKTVAVTGSVGKTTTKDMLYAVMNMQYCTLKTEGNYNNEIGLPLTVMKLNGAHEAVVLEMGMSAFGEIHYLADIARPDGALSGKLSFAAVFSQGKYGL